MTFYQMYGLFFICCCFPIWSESAQTRVEVTSPVYPVSVGGILAIQCEVWNIQDAYRVNLYRVLMNGETEELTTRGEYDSRSSLEQRGFLAKRTFSGGSIVIFLTVIDTLLSDEGEYLCKVYSLVRGAHSDIAQDSMTVEIYTFPDKIYPSCYSSPSIITMTTGRRLLLTCTSDKGFPNVQLNWICLNADVHFTTHDSSNGDKMKSEIALTLDASYNRAIFECKMTSSGFPDRVRSCIIGPLNIESDVGDNAVELTVPPGSKIKNSNVQSGVLKGEICNTPCPPADKYTLLYWAVATMGTTILMFIFLITTIIYCHRYFTISGEVVAAGNSFSNTDGTEPVYVSLQRRPLQERNPMYMSGEDPNNHGNQVLVPREVVDEFYRSLSLKKRDSKH